ncbi:MAG: M28 family peptidase [Candidatus Aminicenantes bacterium]|nr:M28 family peptidase [Candidatus Aminicenantes bacterium]
MKRKHSPRILIGIVILALVHFSTSGGSPSVISKPAINARGPEEISFIKSLVEKISKEELRDHILALQNMNTRYAPSRGNLRAADYIKETLASSGIKNVTFDEFSYYDDQTGTYEMTRNVVASKPGIRTPEKIVIIGAHFDSISRSAEDGRNSILDKENPAPGADDNGTGVATVLAAARILGPQKFDRTLRIVAFSAEEGGIYGRIGPEE